MSNVLLAIIAASVLTMAVIQVAGIVIAARAARRLGDDGVRRDLGELRAHRVSEVGGGDDEESTQVPLVSAPGGTDGQAEDAELLAAVSSWARSGEAGSSGSVPKVATWTASLEAS